MSSERILFKYSQIYDANLSRASGYELTDTESAEGYAFVDKLRMAFEPMQGVFSFYTSIGFKLPEVTPAYLTHPRGTFTPFSDPLTIHILEDVDDVLATLVHEYGHVVFLASENDVFSENIWNQVQAAFPDEDFVTRDHITINKLTEAALSGVWSAEKVATTLAKERALPGLGRAWEIWDTSGVTEWDPVKAIEQLCVTRK